MERVNVQFSNVGRAKLTWTATLPEFTDSALYREVKRRNALGSKGVDFLYNDESNKGVILVGGFREVGQFSVIVNPQAPNA